MAVAFRRPTPAARITTSGAPPQAAMVFSVPGISRALYEDDPASPFVFTIRPAEPDLPLAGPVAGTVPPWVTDLAISAPVSGVYTVTGNIVPTGQVEGLQLTNIEFTDGNAPPASRLFALNVLPDQTMPAVLVPRYLVTDPLQCTEGATTTTPTHDDVVIENGGGVGALPFAGVALVGTSAAYLQATVLDSQPYQATVRLTPTGAGLAALAAGQYLPTAEFGDPNATGTATITATVAVNQPVLSPVLGVSPGGLTFHRQVGDPDPTPVQSFTIRDVNQSALGLANPQVAIQYGPGWASGISVVVTDNGNGTWDAAVTCAAGALPAAGYSATLAITDANCPGQTVTPTITFNVAPAVTNSYTLPYPLPTGLSQDPVTGDILGWVTGAPSVLPSNWNDPTPDHTPSTYAEFRTALAAQSSQDHPVIEVPSGAVLSKSGALALLPPRTGAGKCVIRVSNYQQIDPTRRMHPVTDANKVFWLQATDTNEALGTQDAANGYVFIGMALSDTGPLSRGGATTPQYRQMLVGPQSPALADNSNLPSDFTFWHCMGLGHQDGESYRAISFRCNGFWFRGCHFEDYRSRNTECQAILTGDRCYAGVYDECYMNAAGECFMFGGSPLALNNQALIPQNIWFRRCRFEGKFSWFENHPTWDGIDWGFKNLWEVKRGGEILLSGCVFAKGYRDGQSGPQVVVKSTDNNGANPSGRNTITRNVQFLNCWLHEGARGWALLGNSEPTNGGLPTQSIAVVNCLCSEMNVPPNTAPGYAFEITNRINGVHVDHVTYALNGGVTPDGCILASAAFNVRVTNTIWPQGKYGVKGSNYNEGLPSMNGHWQNYQYEACVHYRGSQASTSTNYPGGNYFATSEAAVGFAALGTLNDPTALALSASSPYLRAATDGTQIGCDVNALAAAVAGV